MNKICKKLDFMAYPSKIYFLAMALGIIVGLIFEKPLMETGYNNFNEIYGIDKFIELFKNNGFLICVFYISIIFTNRVAYCLYGVNGMVLGYTVGFILKSNIGLLLLLLPHGIFEIPCILATGYIVNKGEKFIRTNFKKYVLIFLLHILFVAFCAAIEAFVTPYFINIIV